MIWLLAKTPADAPCRWAAALRRSQGTPRSCLALPTPAAQRSRRQCRARTCWARHTRAPHRSTRAARCPPLAAASWGWPAASGSAPPRPCAQELLFHHICNRARQDWAGESCAPCCGAIRSTCNSLLPAQARGGAQVVGANHNYRNGRRVAHKRVTVLQAPQQVARLVACASQ